MHRWLSAATLVLALGCRKDAPPSPPGSSQPHAAPSPALADAALADAALADAPMRRVELLHAMPATVRVSSRVANAAILPAHLVDRDLGTAWSSATGDLVGAWIEVTVPGQATIAELRMTAGHTGKSPKGEDYFTMNPRIAKVSISRGDGTTLGTFALEPGRRDLQTLAVRTPGGTLRIVVEEIVPGSKKAWREVAISELEVWGDPPPGWQPPPAPLSPTVEVGDPTAGTEESLDALCAAQLEPFKTDPGSINMAPASCGSQTLALPGAKPPFTAVGSTCVVSMHGGDGASERLRLCDRGRHRRAVVDRARDPAADAA